ncbi:MAG: hypothetical protein AAF993_04285 [Pseudomonadota bacterium]
MDQLQEPEARVVNRAQSTDVDAMKMARVETNPANLEQVDDSFARNVAFFSPYLFWLTVGVLCTGILFVR